MSIEKFGPPPLDLYVRQVFQKGAFNDGDSRDSYTSPEMSIAVARNPKRH